MIDMRHSRGIATFIVRFLLFYVVVLLVFSFPLLPGLTFLLSFGMMGVFTFIQVMGLFIVECGWRHLGLLR